ncbi:MAG: tRNA (adenosine(37)-N6)-dimethylallyltransferase MiaA [Alphaproteobacteria bacterium]|nr:tRNA (adenosine(37)-N6)-dimethylallyltransferase MiaA [Alphaproteobacteria bacterium]
MAHETIILIGGPTASGKSALAMRLARQKNGSIINADAMQVYSGLPILTAQPSPEDKAEIPHLLYEITDPAQPSSAGKWLALARAALRETIAKGRTPILVGGTGLYFSALLGGLADIPLIPDDVRDNARRLYETWGEEKFRAELAQRDLKSASRIARNDRQRLIRAFEVVEHTGKALSEWQKSGAGEGSTYKTERHLLLPDRAELYATCDKRFLAMIERGAIDEVRNLCARDLSPLLPSMKILGLREIAAYLHGQMTRENAIVKAQQKTRNYAKRQMTWFRNQWADASA